MADENTGQSQKTEDPTQKKLEDSREKGQVASSREVNNWFMILVMALFVMTLVPSLMSDLHGVFLKFIQFPHAIPMDKGQLGITLNRLALDVLIALSMPLLLLVVVAVLSGLVQTGVIFAPDRLKPKLEKISPLAGAKRLFSLRSLTEFAKGVDHLALRIQDVAREHGIPVVENPAVARALYAAVDLDQEVPPEHFKAVAEIIGYVLRLKGKMN